MGSSVSVVLLPTLLPPPLPAKVRLSYVKWRYALLNFPVSYLTELRYVCETIDNCPETFAQAAALKAYDNKEFDRIVKHVKGFSVRPYLSLASLILSLALLDHFQLFQSSLKPWIQLRYT